MKFFIYALVYLLLDLEILLTFPFAVSEYINDIYGLIIVLLFLGFIIIEFVYELGKSVLKIDSRQVMPILKTKPNQTVEYLIFSSNKVKQII